MWPPYGGLVWKVNPLVIAATSVKKLTLDIQWNLPSRTPVYKGHLHSGDTKFGPGKCLDNRCIFYLC